MEKKYELVKDDTITLEGHTLHRIKALKDFGGVAKGDLGGYIEKEENLSHEGHCWVFDDAKVFINGRVLDNAVISKNAMVYDNASVANCASVSDTAAVAGNAIVSEHAKICDDAGIYKQAVVSGNAIVRDDATVTDNARVKDNAIIEEKTCIRGNAILSTNAYMASNRDYTVLGPIGPDDEFYTFYLTIYQDVVMINSIYDNKEIGRFIDMINDEYEDDITHKLEYLSAIGYALSVLNIKKKEDK